MSQQLAKLEQGLGGQLFDRVNNQLVLTDAGRFLLRKAETVLAEMDKAEAGLPTIAWAGGGGSQSALWPRLAGRWCRKLAALALELVPDFEMDLHELAPA